MHNSSSHPRLPIGRLGAHAGVVLLLTVVFAAGSCGGGGGSGEPAPVPKINLGEKSATMPERVARSWLNPLDVSATVIALPTEGPFSFDPADLPAAAGPRGTLQVGVLFTPTGPGLVTGVITLQFAGQGQVANRSFEISATGEALSWTLSPEPVDFGDVLPGEEREILVTLRNDSLRSPVTFTKAQLPSPAFSFALNPFPLSIAAGQERTVRLKFAPTLVANQGGLLRLGAGDPGGPLDVPLWANSSGAGEQIIDFGTQSLSNGETPILSVEVPADAVSVTFEGTLGEGDEVGLRLLEGPGGRVYENVSGTGPVFWQPWPKTFSLHLPSSDSSATQLVPGGGTYRFQLFRSSGATPFMDVRVILERRPSGASLATVLPLNVFLANGIAPTAATAEGDVNLQGLLTQVGQILGSQNLRLGDVAYYDITDAAYDQIAQGEERRLFALSGRASKVRLNLFLVRQVWGGNVLGLSAAIDGAKRKGESMSGVVGVYLDGSPGANAAIIAHELCHYLGLWHTVEGNGRFDPILDTTQCPVFGTNATCSVAGGGFLMHWQLLGGTTLTAGQGKVLRGHPCCHPPGQANALVAKPGPWLPDARARAYLERLPAGWCGTVRGR